MKKIGLIINPLAGIGGPMGLKGSDGDEIVEKALAMGAVPQSENRVRTALEVLKTWSGEEFSFLCWGGAMGENLLKDMGFEYEVVGRPAGERSKASDTEAAVRAMALAGAEILVFAGGDGTARNVCAAYEGLRAEGNSRDVPVIGIPTGVKIHSAVYALNPINAGWLLKDWLEGKAGREKEAEVMDIDEEQFRKGRVSARLYGYLMAIDSPKHMQCCKSSGASEEDSLLGIAAFVADSMEKDCYYIIGSGSTTRYVMDELELPDTLLGIDLVKDFELVASDLSEPALWEYIKDPAVKVKMVVTVIGGQGNIFGRGNQQLSPRVIRRVGRSNIIVIADPGKLADLPEKLLRVDTGDPALDAELAGYIGVISGYDQLSMIKIAADSAE